MRRYVALCNVCIILMLLSGCGIGRNLQDVTSKDTNALEAGVQLESTEPVLPENPEEWVLSGNILCMEVSRENTTAGRLDLDGDGEKEVLYLDGIGVWGGYEISPYSDKVWLNEKYRVRVDETYYIDYCDMAVSFRIYQG